MFRILSFADASEPAQQLLRVGSDSETSLFWFPRESHSPDSSPLVFPQAAVLPFTPGFAVVPGRDGLKVFLLLLRDL